VLVLVLEKAQAVLALQILAAAVVVLVTLKLVALAVLES
jgi:hypothetical protein